MLALCLCVFKLKMIVFIVTFMALASVNGEHAPNTVNDGSVRMMMDPRIEAQLMPESDALLTDWEGQHWASLDADQDKVALSWTADEKRITFQVRKISFPMTYSVTINITYRRKFEIPVKNTVCDEK